MVKLLLLPFQAATIFLGVWMVDIWRAFPLPLYGYGLMACGYSILAILVGMITWDEYTS